MVAELGNVSRAAARLRIAQPALSRQIRDLEQEVGTPLLERSSRGVVTTEAGRAFALAAKDILDRADAAIKSARSIARGETGELHLGYAPSPTAELLPRALHAFQNAAPGVRIVLHDNTTVEMLRGLRDHSLQAALVVRPPQRHLEGLKFEELISYPMCVATAFKHPLAKKSSIQLRTLLTEKLVIYSRAEYGEYHELLESLFDPLGGVPAIAEECDSGSSLIAAVEALRGVAIVPSVIRCQSGNRLKLRPLLPAPPPLQVGIAYVSARPTPATRLLAETLRVGALVPSAPGLPTDEFV